MSSMDRFDNVIKGRMDSYESAVPSGMWDKIEAARAVEETGRKKFFFMIAALLVTGTIGYFLFDNNSDAAIANNTATEEINQEVAAASSSERAVNKITERKSETIADLSSSDFTATSEATKETVSAVVTLATPDVPTAFSADAKSININTTSNKSAIKKEQESVSLLVSKSAEKRSTTASEGQLVSSPKTFEIISLSDSEPSFIGEVTQLTGSNNEANSIPKNTIENKAQSTRKGKLNWKPLVIKKGIIQPIFNKANIESNVGCVDFAGNKRKGGISFDIYGGPDLVARTLSVNSADDSEVLLAKEETESSEISLHSGIRINRHFRNGLVASGGIMLSQVNEVFSWSMVIGNSEPITTSSIDTIVNDMGQQEIITITSTTTNPLVRNVRTYNRYRFVDIPLTIGYQMNNGPLSLGVHAGPMINMGFYQKGKLLSYENAEPRAINNPSQDELFKNQLGLGAVLRVGVAFNLTSQLQVLAESNSRYYFNQVNTDINPINQSYFITGFSTGLRVHF